MVTQDVTTRRNHSKFTHERLLFQRATICRSVVRDRSLTLGHLRRRIVHEPRDILQVDIHTRAILIKGRSGLVVRLFTSRARITRCAKCGLRLLGDVGLLIYQFLCRDAITICGRDFLRRSLSFVETWDHRGHAILLLDTRHRAGAITAGLRLKAITRGSSLLRRVDVGHVNSLCARRRRIHVHEVRLLAGFGFNGNGRRLLALVRRRVGPAIRVVTLSRRIRHLALNRFASVMKVFCLIRGDSGHELHGDRARASNHASPYFKRNIRGSSVKVLLRLFTREFLGKRVKVNFIGRRRTKRVFCRPGGFTALRVVTQEVIK